MNLYNTIMLWVWLIMCIGSLVFITVSGFIYGFDRWASYYVFSATAGAIYFTKRWMMKRFEKHQAFLDEQDKTPKSE